LVYPELANVKAEKKEKRLQIQGMLKKIRCYVKDAKIDGELMSSLGNSIKILNQLQSIAPTAESMLQQKNTVKS
jgi:hypothetical protein